jgi:hypothetical protein
MSDRKKWLCLVEIANAADPLDGVQLVYGPMDSRVLPAVVAAAVTATPPPNITIRWEEAPDAR